MTTTAAYTAPVAARNAVVVQPRPVKARRRPYLTALGVVLVVLGALAMVYVTSTLGRTRPVLAVTQEVSRGQVIQAKDLVAVDLPTGPTSLKPVSSDDLEIVVGQVATTDLVAGSLLTASSYAKKLEPAPGTSIVGVALTSRQMPTTGLHAGDRVRVVATPSSGGKVDKEPLIVAATVISTETVLTGDQVIVNLEAASEDAPKLAALSSVGLAALVIDSIGT